MNETCPKCGSTVSINVCISGCTTSTTFECGMNRYEGIWQQSLRCRIAELEAEVIALKSERKERNQC